MLNRDYDKGVDSVTLADVVETLEHITWKLQMHCHVCIGYSTRAGQFSDLLTEGKAWGQ